MKIAIIVAMQKELRLLIPYIKDCKIETIDNVTFHSGKIGNNEIIAMQCGIGKVNAAINTLTLINNFHPDLVINTGVAGGTGSEAKILDVVVGKEVAYHDVWCGPETIDGQAAGCPERFTCAPMVSELLDKLPHKVKYGLIASGDMFVADADVVKRILTLYPEALAVDMESAAIAHTCYLKNTPFCAIRVVSDTPGEADNISQYENFWEDAPQSTFSTLLSILELL